MIKPFAPLMLTALLSIGAASPALAAEETTLDLGDTTCGEFSDILQENDNATNTMLMMWIDGYLSGVSGDTVLNWQGLTELTSALSSYCTTHPQSNLLQAARKLGIEK